MTELDQANAYIERLNRQVAELYKQLESEMMKTATLEREIERLKEKEK